MIDRSIRGFTLIELMIVVAIIAILATIAYPSYIDYVIRSNRSAAQQFILDIAQRQEQFLMDNRAYAATTPADLTNGTITALNIIVPDEVKSRYTVAIATSVTPPTYTITVTPKSGTIQANDVTLTMNQAGAKEPPDKWK